MGWEQRGNHSYYYRKVRKGRQVISEYVGSGEVAQLICLMDESDREKTRIEQKTWKNIKDENQNVDTRIESLNQTIKNLVTATLLASGHHPHKGQWRKLRNA